MSLQSHRIKRPYWVLMVPVLAFLIVGIAAAIVLTSINVTNTVNVTPGVALGIATFQVAPSVCPTVGDPLYGVVSPFTNTIKWNITAGGSTTQHFCIENQGSGADVAPSIKLGTVTGITCSVSQCVTLSTNPSTIPALNAQSVSLPISVTLTVDATASGSGTLNIIIS